MTGPVYGDADVRQLLTGIGLRLDQLTAEVCATRSQLTRLVRLAGIFYTAGRQDESSGLPPDRFPL